MDKKDKDCILELVNLSSTPFDKAVVKEFIEIENKIEKRFTSLENKMENLIKTLKYGLSIATPILVAILIKVLIGK